MIIEKSTDSHCAAKNIEKRKPNIKNNDRGYEFLYKKTTINRQKEKNNNKFKSKGRKSLIRYIKSDTLCPCPGCTTSHMCV